MEFNLQTFLSEMRQEQREDNQTLSNKIDTSNEDLSNKIEGVTKTLGEHHTRLTVVENTRRLLIGLGAVLGTAAVGILFDVIYHLFK